MIDNGGPAHPVFVVSASADDEELNAMTRQLERLAPGVSVRDYFAGQALAALADKIANDGNKTAGQRCAAMAYEYADAMLAERAKPRI